MANLDFELALLTANRLKLKEIMEQQPAEKLLRILPGFNNNVLWHIGHSVVSQQRLVYWRSGLPLNISEQYVNNFKIGSSPKNWTDTPDIAEVKDSLITTVEKLKEDIKNNVFVNYEPHKTTMGFTLANYIEAITYANFHEAEHTGNLKYLLRLME